MQKSSPKILLPVVVVLFIFTKYPATENSFTVLNLFPAETEMPLSQNKLHWESNQEQLLCLFFPSTSTFFFYLVIKSAVWSHTNSCSSAHRRQSWSKTESQRPTDHMDCICPSLWFKKKSSNPRSTIMSLRKTAYLYSGSHSVSSRVTKEREQGGRRVEEGGSVWERGRMNLMRCSRELWQSRHLFEHRLLL